MESTFLGVGNKPVFSQFLKNLRNGIDVRLAWIFGIDEDVIEVNSDKDIEFLSQNLVNIALKAGRYFEQPKRHYLILKVAVSSLKSRLLFVALFYSHLIVSTCEVKLDKLFCLVSSI